MESVNCSLIISVYKNTAFLKEILDNLPLQSRIPDEVIVSEDGESEEMRNFLADYKTIGGVPVRHLTQSDRGWQKNQALNQAILQAKTDYLIFIDGDCVLHTKFVENHLKLSHPKKILAGKRVKLGAADSEILKLWKLRKFQNSYLRRFSRIKKQGGKFVEEGVYMPLNGVTAWIIKKLGISSIKGCNFSCYKHAMIEINGFDEDYLRPAIGEDHDLVWRFKGMGYEVLSVKHFCIQYHLDHPESWTSQEENQRLYETKVSKGNFRCINGLSKRP